MSKNRKAKVLEIDPLDGAEATEAAGATPAVKPKTKAKDGAMSKGDFQKLVTDQATDAADFIVEEFSIIREQATNYYKGRLPDVDGENVEEDRSTAVLTTVRDTVLGMMPSLLRIFFSADGVCQYKAIPTDNAEEFKKREQDARDATEFVRKTVLAKDNPDNFFSFHAAFQDALVRKTGVLKWWWQKSKKPDYCGYTGLTLEQLTAIVGDGDIIEKRARPMNDAVLGPTVVYDVTVRRVRDHGAVRIAAVPTEAIFFSRTGKSLTDTPLFGYSEDKTESQFVEMGFEAADLADCDADDKEADGLEQVARKPNNTGETTADPPEDETLRKYKYSEIYILADRDGDGIAELNRVIAAGTKYKVLEAKPFDEIPFALFCPYPEAHQMTGDSAADLTMDLQRIGSRIMRDVLDSLAQSITPATAVVEGQVNLDDVLNGDVSKVIRMRQPGMVQPFVVPFVGKEGMPILDFLNNVREGRTGMSDASQGLDPKVLQSTDAQAVTATLSMAQSRIEMIARIFAEGGMKRLFRGVLKLLVKHQDAERHTDDGRKITPKSWSPDMDVEPTIPLGRGSAEQQISFLLQVLAKQEQIMQMLGPINPLCSIDHYRYTLAKILELASWVNVDSFFADPSKLPPEQRKQIEDAMTKAMGDAAKGGQAGPTGPDPATEQAKIKSNEAVKMAELQFKRDELSMNAQLAQSKLEAEMRVRVFEAQLQHKGTMDTAQLDAQVKQVTASIAAHTKIIVEQLKPRGGADQGNK